MKKLALGLLALFLAFSPARDLDAQGIGPTATILCNKSATFTGTGAAATVITGTTGTIISVCGWHVTNTAATGGFAISTGTTATCGTGTVAITPTLSVTNTAPSSDHIDFAIFSATQGANVCVNATLTTVTGVLWYSQQ